MPKSEGYVSADYLRKAAALVGPLKRRSHELMAIRPGHAVLDVGCGPGMDTVVLAAHVGESGRVVGVDIDEQMLEQADAYAREEGVASRVEHRKADVAALPFADGAFDSVRAERLFQVLPASYDPARVLGELARVIKAGGRIVLVDTDWASASVDFPDAELERRLMRFFADRMRPNGYAGRQLFRLLVEEGFGEVAAEAHPSPLLDFGQTPFGDWLMGEAAKAAVATSEELDGWTRILSERDSTGRFYASVDMVAAWGVKV